MDRTAGKRTGGEFAGRIGGVKQQRQGLKIPAASFFIVLFDRGEGDFYVERLWRNHREGKKNPNPCPIRNTWFG